MITDFASQCLNQSITERISVQLTVDLGAATISLAEVLALANGSKLSVTLPNDDTLALRLSGKPLAYGRIITTEAGIMFEVIRSHSTPPDRKELVEGLGCEHYQGS